MTEKEVIDAIKYMQEYQTETDKIEAKTAEKGCPQKCYDTISAFANKRGGIKAVITTAIIGGFILTVLCAISIPMVSSTVGTFLQVYGGNEYSVWVIIADALAKLLSVIGL